MDISQGPWRYKDETVYTGVMEEDPIGKSTIYDSKGNIILLAFDCYAVELKEDDLLVMTAGPEMLRELILAALTLRRVLNIVNLDVNVHLRLKQIISLIAITCKCRTSDLSNYRLGELLEELGVE